MKYIFVIFSFLSAFFAFALEDRELISANIQFDNKVEKLEVLKKAEELKRLQGMQKIWVTQRKDSYGIHFFQKYDGTKEGHIEAMNKLFSVINKKDLSGWDITSKVYWI